MSSRGWTVFAATGLVWGLPYLLVKVAVDDGVPNATIAFVRVALAAAVLVPIAWRTGALHGLRHRAGPLGAYAALEIVLPFALINFGLEHVSSSLAAILVAAVPLGVALLALRVDPEEQVGGVRLLGLLVGLGGVVLLLGVDVAGDPRELLGAAAILVATLGYAAGPLVVKHRLHDVRPLGAVAAGVLIATVAFAPAAVLTAPSTVPSAGASAALVAAGLVCTALGFLLYFVLINEAGPGHASVVTYVNPVVAVALGVTFLDESLTAAAIAGLLLILVGSFAATGGARPATTIAAGPRALPRARGRGISRARAHLRSWSVEPSTR